jgi:phosphatidylserine/phosphatidylglycerophosphate/cardiolipin synthase-like enzyme
MPSSISERLEKQSSTIKNNNNKIVHDLTCKFSKLIKNGEITTTKGQTKQCSVCSYYSNRKEILKESPTKRKFNLATHKKFENFELFLIDPHKETQPNKNCTSEICKAIIQEINSAQKSIDIALYGIGEQEGIYML